MDLTKAHYLPPLDLAIFFRLHLLWLQIIQLLSKHTNLSRGGPVTPSKIWEEMHLEPETSTLSWAFQLDDSKSLHEKLVFHQTSINKNGYQVYMTYEIFCGQYEQVNSVHLECTSIHIWIGSMYNLYFDIKMHPYTSKVAQVPLCTP